MLYKDLSRIAKSSNYICTTLDIINTGGTGSVKRPTSYYV